MPNQDGRLAFPPRTPFFIELQARVNAYFERNGLRKTGNRRLYLKAALAYLLFAGGYAGLVFYAESLLGAVLFALMLTQGMVLIAFNVMHDGAHGSFSRRPWLNRLAGASMDLLGSSQTLWQQKHNMLHHTYTNVAGKDDDLELGGLMRLSPRQAWRPWHRAQHLYAPLLYSLLTLFLAGFGDFHKLLTNRISDTALQKRAWWELPYFVMTKAAYFGYALVIPMLFHPAWQVLVCFVGIHLLLGFTLSLVFQLAHTVMEAEFPAGDENGRMPYDWAEHQLRTTANFAVGNRLVQFYTGGLNQQVEHHLFHKISHIHYPQLAAIVRRTCQEYGIPYHANRSLTSAIRSHFRFLREMGRAAA
ncbi:acyl-CoA desaturase [Cupriavidus basilensis]|uniref:Acyl-CoA desaturase n=1 Tax=Cupriavidus basilensis TaxID=68895 RepID=A0ABT6AGG3_9BURK|nr:acyl-CoA desaturase [Cupriavidus basilensis]MDF3831549.1 acyl-CoA desaturase [Cupriavidus basilensis]